jgi:hypothetical protein
MIATMWDILQLTNPWDVDHCSYVRLSPAYKPERKPLRRVHGSYLRQSWNVEMASSLQRVEKNSRWFSCVTQWERWSAELDVPVAEHKVNMWNPKVLGASSWEQKWRWCISLLWAEELMRNSRWLSCVMQWERRSVEWTCLWTSTCERDPSGWALVSVVLLWDTVR